MGTKWGHREVVEGQWEAIAIKCTSPTAMSISRSEIFREKKRKVQKMKKSSLGVELDAH